MTQTARWPRDGCPNTAHMGGQGRCCCCFPFPALALSSLKPFKFGKKLPVCMKDSILQVRRTQDATIPQIPSGRSDLSADKCNPTHQFTDEPPAGRSVKCSPLCSGSQLNLRKLGFVERYSERIKFFCFPAFLSPPQFIADALSGGVLRGEKPFFTTPSACWRVCVCGD